MTLTRFFLKLIGEVSSMALTSAFGEVEQAPSDKLTRIFTLHRSQLDNMSLALTDTPATNQHVWTTSNGWIGLTAFSMVQSSNKSGVGSFLSVLKTVGHDLEKAAPVIVEIGLEVAEDAAESTGRASEKPDVFNLKLTPVINGKKVDGSVNLLITRSSVGPKQDTSSLGTASLTSIETAFLKAMGQFGAAAMRTILPNVGNLSPMDFTNTTAATIASIIPNVVSAAIS